MEDGFVEMIASVECCTVVDRSRSSCMQSAQLSSVSLCRRADGHGSAPARSWIVDEGWSKCEANGWLSSNLACACLVRICCVEGVRADLDISPNPPRLSRQEMRWFSSSSCFRSARWRWSIGQGRCSFVHSRDPGLCRRVSLHLLFLVLLGNHSPWILWRSKLTRRAKPSRFEAHQSHGGRMSSGQHGERFSQD